MFRSGYIDLDLSTHELLTLPPDHDDVAQFNKLSDKHRSGQVDSMLLRDGQPIPNGHPAGESIRIARDRISGLYFGKVADHYPDEENKPHLVKKAAQLRRLKPIHVPGEGFWVPLKEIFPDHPHATSQPIRDAHSPAAPQPAVTPVRA